MPRASAAVLCLALACTGGTPEAPRTPAPTLVLVDSVVLADSGVLALGDLANAGLHVADAAVWVADVQGGRIVRFDRDGRAISQVGRRGRGPGELAMPGALVALADDAVAAWNVGNGKLVAFDASDGRMRWETPIREQAFPIQLQAVGDTLWFGAVSASAGTGAMRLVARDTQPATLAPLPAEYAAGLAGPFPFSVALRLRDTLLAGYAGHHRIFLHRGAATDSLVVPVRRRRGVPVDLLAQMRAGLAAREEGKGAENYVSMLFRAARLPDGAIALVHYDPSFDLRASRPATAEVWLTVVDAAFERACVDAPLPLTEPTLPSLAFRGDTLFTLEHAVDDAGATAVLRAFTVSTAGCEWMPVTRG